MIKYLRSVNSVGISLVPIDLVSMDEFERPCSCTLAGFSPSPVFDIALRVSENLSTFDSLSSGFDNVLSEPHIRSLNTPYFRGNVISHSSVRISPIL